MNDRYLFKAKRKNWRDLQKEEWWVAGYYVRGFDVFEEPIHVILDPTTIFDNDKTDGWDEIDPSTLCQCTGLKDKNGTLIWENDVVRYCDCTEERYVIAWEENKACFEYQQYGCSIMNFDELSGIEVEVIGSYIDNPELLEVE